MEKRYVADIVRALGHLRCTEVETLRVGKSYHVTALRPTGERVYLQAVPEVEQLILALTREQARG